MQRVIFTEKRVLMEGKSDDQARLDEVARIIDIQSSVTSRKYNYVLNKEDIAQHLWLVYLDDLQKSDIPLVNKVLQQRAIDYARYEIRRGNSTTDYATGVAAQSAQSKAATGVANSTGSGVTTEFGGSVADTQSKRVLSADRFSYLDAKSSLYIREMLSLIEDEYGDGSREYFYMLGEIARQGMLTAVKNMVHPLDYREVAKKVGVSGRDTGAAGIAELMKVGVGSGGYRAAVQNVVNTLKANRYKV